MAREGALSIERVETGRVHTVGGAEQPITDERGRPEWELVLFAVVDGAKIALQRWNAGQVEAQVANAKAREAEDEGERDDDAE